MTGTLYVVGVGPGDPELLTLKAIKILNEIPCLFVPKGREEGSSLALSIIEKTIDLSKKEIIEVHFPMIKTKQQWLDISGQGLENSDLDNKWAEAVKNILNKLTNGINVAFITLGDPTIYSTFFYLYDKLVELEPRLNIEIIPGISSINASAAKAKTSLGLADEKIAILPATYTDNIKETLERFDTVVLMKIHRVFNKMLNILNEMNLADNAVYISRAGMEDEKIFKDIRDVREGDLNYFSVVIIKK
jgi:precorrin-2/cobalt-factor-2 C20-methyltransferase